MLVETYSKKQLLNELTRKQAIKKYRELWPTIKHPEGVWGKRRKRDFDSLMKALANRLEGLEKYIPYTLQSIYTKERKYEIDHDQADYANNITSIVELVKSFDDLVKKGKLENKDISSKEYKIESDHDVVRLQNLFKKLDKEKQTRSEVKALGAEKIYDDSKYLVIVPKTFEASCYYGAGTKWCTTSNKNHLMSETKRAVLYYIIDKSKEPYDPETKEGDNLSKVALQQYYNGDQKMWNSQDGSLSFDERYDLMNTYPKAMRMDIINHFYVLKKKRDEVMKDIDDPLIKAIMAAYGDDVGEHLQDTEDGYHQMSLYEDDDNNQFAVGSEEDVNEAGYMHIEGLVDDIGWSGFSDWVWEYIKENFVDESHFEDLLRDDMQYYIDEMREEEAYDPDKYEDRLEEEMNEHGYDDEDEFKESLVDDHGNPIEWYIDNYGDSGFNEIASEHVDEANAIKWVQEQDGDSFVAGNEVEWVTVDGVEYGVMRL